MTFVNEKKKRSRWVFGDNIILPWREISFPIMNPCVVVFFFLFCFNSVALLFIHLVDFNEKASNIQIFIHLLCLCLAWLAFRVHVLYFNIVEFSSRLILETRKLMTSSPSTPLFAAHQHVHYSNFFFSASI